MIVQTTDNKDWHKPQNLQPQDLVNLAKIADINIGKLSVDDRANLLVFPYSIILVNYGKSRFMKSLFKKVKICRSQHVLTKTQNAV